MSRDVDSGIRHALSGDIAASLAFSDAPHPLGELDTAAVIEQLQAQARRYQTAIDNISQGVCFFDANQRLILCNRRYAEIYRLTMDQVPPGSHLREIAERRSAVGTCPMAVDDYLEWGALINAGMAPRTWTANLPDGRIIKVYNQRMPDGGWVSTHEDITEQEAKRAVANERISLQTLIDWVPDYLWVKDAESRFMVVNKALAADSGKVHTSDMIGLTDFDIHSPELAEEFYAKERAVLQSGEPMVGQEEAIIDAHGVRRWLLSTKVRLINDKNEVFGLVGIARDITARKLEDILRQAQAEILEMIATSAPLETILDHLVRLIEGQGHGLLGSVLLLDKEGRHLTRGASPHLAEDYMRMIDGMAIGEEAGSCGTAVFRRETVVVKDIAEDPLWRDYAEVALRHGYRSCWSTPILSHENEVLGVFALYSGEVREPSPAEVALVNIATRLAGIAIQRKQSEDRIHFMANHDTLTGLPNRALLKDRLAQALLYAQRYDRWVTVVFIDLDNFKLINDSLGHTAGDALLKWVSARMLECVRATDTVVRVGGDEFVILLFDQPRSAEMVSTFLQKIKAVIAQPVELEGQMVHITSSIGIASYPNDGDTAEVLLANADAAMYRAKETGRDNFQFYTPELNTRIHEKFTLQRELRNALTNSEFVLHYQPQADLRTGRIFAAEALVRWRHPVLGMVPPIKFIPVAEETNLIVPLGDWVLHEACRQAKEWQDQGLPPIGVCVNVSARQFREKNLVSRVVHALDESGLDPHYLEVEITESLIMQNLDQAIAVMRALKELGVQLAIDDFGTGYSSLSSLKTFPVARLKIDKSFIDDIPSSENDKAVTTAIISLGRSLQMRVIAEGVETDAQVAFLRENHCDEMQGYHLSRPIIGTEIAALLRRQG